MPKYLSLMLSPNIEKTPEGYLICRNVPICRSGFQEYYGRELKGFPGYQDSWGLDPETKYSVQRPKDEVLHPDTIASFNGKTVVDEHPDGAVVLAENEEELHCGHVQDVKEGPSVTIDGKEEVTLQADLHIKIPELIEKIYPEGDPESGVRDVSCGYALKLKRLADGTLVMYHIRGNHVAVVSKGRAGDKIAIQDSAPPEIKKEKRKPIMNLMDLILGRGIKAVVPDASPEEISAITKDLTGNKVTVIPAAVATDSAAKDAKPHHQAAHACLQRLLDAKGSKDGMGCDADGKPANIEALKKELNKYLGEEEKEPQHQNDAEEEEGEKKETLEELEEKEDKGKKDKKKGNKEESDEKTVAEEEGGEDGAADAEDAEDAEDGATDADEIDDPGESVLKQANDSIREYIKATKPLVALIIQKPKTKRDATEQIMVDSYNKAVKGVNAAGSAYVSLAKVKTPTGIPALSMATDSHSVVKIETGHNCTCFDGVPYAKGKKIHEAALLAEKGSK